MACPEILLNPIKGFKVITFPAEWKKRVEGNSSITIESYFSYLKVLLKIYDLYSNNNN